MDIADRLIAYGLSRKPDVVIGGEENPYLLRWHLVPRNRFFNVYLHLFLRSDDDRALHCHPWWSLRRILKNEYTEHTIAQGGVHLRTVMRQGSWKLMSGKQAHRVELHNGPVWTLFITGPRYRRWGFHCPNGWVFWKDFVEEEGDGDIKVSRVGKGCNQ